MLEAELGAQTTNVFWKAPNLNFTFERRKSLLKISCITWVQKRDSSCMNSLYTACLSLTNITLAESSLWWRVIESFSSAKVIRNISSSVLVLYIKSQWNRLKFLAVYTLKSLNTFAINCINLSQKLPIGVSPNQTNLESVYFGEITKSRTKTNLLFFTLSFKFLWGHISKHWLKYTYGWKQFGMKCNSALFIW